MKAIVFGGSSGIGKGVAARLAQENADVLICARNPEKLAAAAAELRGKGRGAVEWRSVDLSNDQKVRDEMRAVLETFGAPDAVLLNGGGPPVGTFGQISVEQWEASFREIVLSNVMILKTLLPQMNGGSVAFVLSDVTRAAAPNKLLPCSLRLALSGMMKCLALEYASKGIRFNALSPGPVETERARTLLQATADRTGSSFEQVKQNFEAGLPMSRMGSPSEIAELAYFLLSERSSYLTGVNVACDGGLTLSPL